MKLLLLLLYCSSLAVVSDATVSNCNLETSPGSCLDPGSSTGCTSITCPVGTPQCKQVVFLSHWIAASVARTCVAAGTPGCTPATSPTTENGVVTDCVNSPAAVTSLVGKSTLKCFVCSGSKTSACAKILSILAPQDGGWTASSACIGCWTNIIRAAGVVPSGYVVSRGCISRSKAAPPTTFNCETNTGQIATTCWSNLCNGAAMDISDLKVTIPKTTVSSTTPKPTPTPLWDAVVAACDKAAAACKNGESCPVAATPSYSVFNSKCDASSALSIISTPLMLLCVVAVLCNAQVL